MCMRAVSCYTLPDSCSTHAMLHAQAPFNWAVAAATSLRSSHSYAARLQFAALTVYGAAACLRLALQQQRGQQQAATVLRGLSALLAVLVNCWVPLLFHQHQEILSRVIAVIALPFIANFKVAGGLMNRGPLAHRWTLPQFAVLYALPVYPLLESTDTQRGRLQDSAGSVWDITKALVTNTGLLIGAVYLLASFDLPVIVRHYTYAVGLSAFITVAMTACASLLVALLGLQLVPPFDNPWFMTSLSDYWARRWNVTTSSLLRAVVYDPIEEGRLVRVEGGAAAAAPAGVQQQDIAGSGNSTPGEAPGGQRGAENKRRQPSKPRPSKARKLLGMTATFAASGVTHELLLRYMTTPWQPGRWLVFFTMQAPLCAAESALHKFCRAHGRPLPRGVAMVLANLLLLTSGRYFFFPPVESSGLAGLVLSKLVDNLQGMRHWGQVLLLHPAAILS